MTMSRCRKHNWLYHNSCLKCREERAKAEKKAQEERKAALNHCKGCTWLRMDSGKPYCPFMRCVRDHGFVVVDKDGGDTSCGQESQQSRSSR